MGLLQYIHHDLDQIDYSKTSSKIILAMLAFLVCVILYAISGILSNLSPTYRNLTAKEKNFWNSAFMRIFCGFFYIIYCTWGILFDNELEKDVIYGTSPESFVLVSVSLGFFVFECFVLTMSDIRYRRCSFLLQIHHWMALFVCLNSITHDCLHFLSYKLFLLEMSGPFTSVSWILLKADKGQTTVWKINQFVLVHIYHLRSIVEFSLCYYTLYKYRNEIVSELPLSTLVIGYTMLFLLTFLLTPYWTYKKTIQLLVPKEFDFTEAETTRNSNGHIMNKRA